MRALYYYYLVEQFGDIPFPLKPYDVLQTEGERVPEAEIYQQLITDLESAQNILPDKSADFGRVTKGMAQMLLSKLYLTRGYKPFAQTGDFENAAKYADAIINSGTYRLLDEFQKIFTPGNEKNEEIIFSVQYTKDKLLNGSGNNYHSKFGIAYDNFIGGQRSNYYNRHIRVYNETFHTIECFGVDTLNHPGQSYKVPSLLNPLDRFPENCSYKIDKRYDATFRRLCMVEVSTFAARKYGIDQTTKFQVWAAGEGSSKVDLTYDPSQYHINVDYWQGTGRDTSLYIPAPDESHLWPAERFMNVPYGVVPRKLWFKDNNSKEKKMFEEAYGEVPNTLWFHTDWLQARPFIDKFWEPESYYDDNQGVRDLFLMRLGEVYLIAAEAYYKAGNSALAAERINTIRRRACGSDYMDIKAADVDIDFILDERTRELAAEELRWVELKRTGKLKERTLKYNYWANSPFIPGGKPYLDDFHYLRPIPYSWWSLLSNKEDVKQNPGYE
ncbi:RagB/SusD family nutrient uptake outer membrane protein [Parabacteroides sp.]